MAGIDLSYSPCLLEDDIFTFETCDRSEIQILDSTQDCDITAGVSESEFQDSLNALFKTIEEHCDEPDNTSIPASTESTVAVNPLLDEDLRGALVSECKQTNFPSMLFQSMLPGNQLPLTTRECELLKRFHHLERFYADQVRELSTLFRFHASSIEMKRMEVMADTSLTCHYRDWLSRHFDTQIHQVIDRVEKSLSLLEEKEKKSMEIQMNIHVPGVKRRPPLSKRAVQLMEGWYQSNLHHPYPSAIVYESLAVAGNVTVEQVKKWFGNKRNRNSNTRTRSEIAKRKFRNRHGIQEYHILRALECGY
ncbi:uncharacterized protein [Haliotis cracherodii]|uniref:uncharacterized protein n=1 Tax=Haliotis cracherodii TaxID=6455 RepID=UPI0039EB291E